MPELPEVETIRQDIASLVVGRGLVAVKVYMADPLRGYSPARFLKRLRGQRFVGVGRRAKILILDLDSGDKLLIHLKMSGRLLYLPAGSPMEKHTHVVFTLDNGYELRFVDMRRFGYLKLVEGGRLEDVAELKGLGPEPLDVGFSEIDFFNLISGKTGSRRAIKALLIDQAFLAGVGNLYADEILHAAKIDPLRPAGSFKRADISRLYQVIRDVLDSAIKMRGTSFDLYVDARGRQGGYVEKLQVYGRPGQPCYRCGAILKKTRVAGRGTHFCPECQR